MRNGNRIPVLDQGYLEVIETYGSDERIVESARMSTAKGFLGWGPKHSKGCYDAYWAHYTQILEWEGCDCIQTEPFPEVILTHEQFCPRFREFFLLPGARFPRATKEAEEHLVQHSRQFQRENPTFCLDECGQPGDEKLLAYLHSHRHNSPFEMAGAIIEVQAPIMVFREWHRHRTQSYNERSARYTALPDVNYVPDGQMLLRRALEARSTTNRQAMSVARTDTIDLEKVLAWLNRLHESYTLSQAVYEEGLRAGIPKELARLPVPVARYSVMRAHANLRNWLQFLDLRCAPDAQWEIRQYANVLRDALTEHFPRTMALFTRS